MKLKLTILTLALCLSASAKIKVEKGSVTPQTEYAASLLKSLDQGYTIALSVSKESLPAEGFTIVKEGKKINVIGNDGPGAIYGANRLKEYYLMNRSFEGITTITEAPEMVLRGACVGLQKTVAQCDMIPTLKPEEKQQILIWLKEARELAIDAESSKKKHEVFGKYKGRINNYLSKRGYDLTKEREAWYERVKARGGQL